MNGDKDSWRITVILCESLQTKSGACQILVKEKCLYTFDLYDLQTLSH